MNSQKLIWLGGIFAGAIFVGLLLRLFVQRTLSRWAAKTPSKIDDYVVSALAQHILLWSVLLGAVFAIPLIPISPRMESLFHQGIIVLFLGSLFIMLGGLASALAPLLANRFTLPLSTTTFSTNLVRLFIYTLGLLLIFSNLGIAIGPLITALGVGSIAVGLALQETLANIFAGMTIFISQQIKVGDYIEVERGIGYTSHRGYVMDITWRTTCIRTLTDITVWIPNSAMTQSIIRQFEVGKDLAVIPIDVQLDAQADLAHAEQVARRVVLATFKDGVRCLRVQFLSAREPILMTVLLESPRSLNQDSVTTRFIKELRTQWVKEPVGV